MDGPPISICSIASANVTFGFAIVCLERIEIHDHEIDRQKALIAPAVSCFGLPRL